MCSMILLSNSVKSHIYISSRNTDFLEGSISNSRNFSKTDCPFDISQDSHFLDVSRIRIWIIERGSPPIYTPPTSLSETNILILGLAASFVHCLCATKGVTHAIVSTFLSLNPRSTLCVAHTTIMMAISLQAVYSTYNACQHFNGTLENFHSNIFHSPSTRTNGFLLQRKSNPSSLCPHPMDFLLYANGNQLESLRRI